MKVDRLRNFEALALIQVLDCVEFLIEKNKLKPFTTFIYVHVKVLITEQFPGFELGSIDNHEANNTSPMATATTRYSPS